MKLESWKGLLSLIVIGVAANGLFYLFLTTRPPYPPIEINPETAVIDACFERENSAFTNCLKNCYPLNKSEICDKCGAGLDACFERLNRKMDKEMRDIVRDAEPASRDELRRILFAK